MQKTNIHSFDVEYEDNARDGVRYLRDELNHDESKVFFDEAHRRGSAQFEDHIDRKFTLTYANGIYILIRR